MQVLFFAWCRFHSSSSSQSDNPTNEPIYVVDGAITNKNSINMDDVGKHKRTGVAATVPVLSS